MEYFHLVPNQIGPGGLRAPCVLACAMRIAIGSVGTKKIRENTPGTAGSPGGRDRTLAVKSIYLLVMPKYWVKNYFAHGRFPEVGQKQKMGGKKRGERERETERW